MARAGKFNWLIAHGIRPVAGFLPIPQLVEVNTPRRMDAAGKFLY
jgi:hypothetical protein